MRELTEIRLRSLSVDVDRLGRGFISVGKATRRAGNSATRLVNAFRAPNRALLARHRARRA